MQVAYKPQAMELHATNQNDDLIRLQERQIWYLCCSKTIYHWQMTDHIKARRILQGRLFFISHEQFDDPELLQCPTLT